MFLTALVWSVVVVLNVLSARYWINEVQRIRAGRKAGAAAKTEALAAKTEAMDRCAKLDRENAVLRAHNEAFDRRRIIGDWLIPDIVESTGEDIDFVCDVLDRAYKWAREAL